MLEMYTFVVGGGGGSVLVHQCGNYGLPEVVMLTDENEYVSSFI